MTDTDRTGAGKVGEFVQVITPMGGHVPSVLGIEGIGCRIKEIASHRNRQGKHGRVTGSKEMDTDGWRKTAFCSHHHLYKFSIPVGFHERDDSTNGTEPKSCLRQSPPGLFTKVWKQTTLNRSGKGVVLMVCNIFCLHDPVHRHR
ncbi:MAG: hypothetical protein BWY45_02389 [Euryarchaeota archaeon ADurb.Bin294]|nr:MAG: hypothetical protein BWY45_02389 [Euryarchaeota archaeon ADurb.Bin294]